ncbi:hypothetical protein V6N11_082645 [Hibiscus sabdariffa]|uniref:Endonuclease/exonuclease/phosphatase domain-containing protein n=1 Tax=Hibiscus sabdariffa TaxID=183260 RepID=A0ABR2P9A4_9ROSI
MRDQNTLDSTDELTVAEDDAVASQERHLVVASQRRNLVVADQPRELVWQLEHQGFAIGGCSQVVKLHALLVCYSYWFVSILGLAGGLALWWTTDVQIGVIRKSSNLIDVSVSVSGEESWFCTFIYGPPYKEEKHQFWENLSSLRNDNFSRWCVLGDSNIISNQSKKEGGSSGDNSHIGWFHELLDSTRLLDLPIKGGTFTWSNMRCDDEAIVEKLDRILISNEWSLKFPKAIGILEAVIASDHNPIVLLFEGLKKRRKREFKFESQWLLKDDCSSKVREAWDNQIPCSESNVIVKKLKTIRLRMSKWSRLKFANNKRSIEDIKKRIRLLQSSPLSSSSKEEILALKHESHKLWESEERHWHQRARINWLKYGDKNTKFFHATTIQKQRQNAILKIKNDLGLWIEEEQAVYSHIENHFKKIYSKDPSVNCDCITDLIPPCITEDINRSLSKEITE